LGTRLEGFAVHHHGGGNQHTHFVIRGRHENGKSLFIDPEYIKSGFRHSAEQYLTREFGERSDREIAAGHERSMEIDHEREQGLERVQEYAREYGLEEKDRLGLERVMHRGSMKEIEQTHRRLDALEQLREVEQEIPRERVQELERTVLDGSQKEVRQVERQIERVQEREQTLERSRDYGMEL
jgi:type IV secretory pathway VirD2 relaxase